jgi:hypothetical protein
MIASVVRGAAALAFAAALQATPAAAAPNRSHFQATVNMSCIGGTCTAIIVDLQPNQALDIESVRCHFSVQGATYYGYVAQLPNDPDIRLPLEALWTRSSGVTSLYTLGSDTTVRIAKDRELRVVNSYTGTNPNGFCTVVGDKLTYPS